MHGLGVGVVLPGCAGPRCTAKQWGRCNSLIEAIAQVCEFHRCLLPGENKHFKRFLSLECDKSSALSERQREVYSWLVVVLCFGFETAFTTGKLAQPLKCWDSRHKPMMPDRGSLGPVFRQHHT